MRKYLDIIRIDLMTMNGTKNSIRSLMILVFAGSIAGELFLSPLFGMIGLLMVGAMSVPMVFTSHSKYHSEKMFGLLPITRRELVTARFILFVALYLAMSIVMYIFMEVSLVLGIYAEITADLGVLLAKMSVGIEFSALCRLMFFIFFAFGMAAVASSLKGYFSDPQAFETMAGAGTAARKMKPGQLIAVLLILAAYVVFFLLTTGVITLSAAASVILQLFVQLFTAGNGILFSIVMLVLSAFTAIYNYFCTVLEYEDKDI